jgi:hypothetical protein
MELRDENGGPPIGLRDTLSRALSKDAGIISVVVEQLEQGRGVDGTKDSTAISVEQSDGQVDGAGIFLQRCFP